jgi:hypothetical protein
MTEQKTNYSYLTSLPAYHENIIYSKQRQCDIVLGIIKKGANNLLQISQVSGIPQAIVSARMSDLIEDKKTMYEGCVVYNNRLRKKIVIVETPAIIYQQPELFDLLK